MTEEKQTITMPIEGMTCASCVAHVQRGLKEVDGVLDVNVNLATEQASVVLAPEQVPLMRLVDAVRDTGYDVPTKNASLPIGGMNCAACVAHVERALAEVPGVLNVSVNLATEKAAVEYIPTAAATIKGKTASVNNKSNRPFPHFIIAASLTARFGRTDR